MTKHELIGRKGPGVGVWSHPSVDGGKLQHFDERPSMIEHELKTQWEAFQAIKFGDKTFEVRRNDRLFQKGDTIILRCMQAPGCNGLMRVEPIDAVIHTPYDHSEPELAFRVTYVLTGEEWGIKDGYCVLGLKPWEYKGPADRQEKTDADQDR